MTGARKSSKAPKGTETPKKSARRARGEAIAADPNAGPPMTLQRFLAMPRRERPMFVVADGMGVDSSAMLEGLRRLGIVPDRILHADTGDEWPETEAFREVRQAWLKKIGFPPFSVVRRPPSVSQVTGLAFSTLGEKCIAYHTLPGQAFGTKSCSVEWKIVPQEEYLAEDPQAKATWARGQKVVKAIGYDAGPKDSRRAHELKEDDDYQYVYPLRAWGWDRARCIAELRWAGAPIPRKSSCFFCPAAKPWEIAELVRDYPKLADRIIEIEDTALPYIRIEGFWTKTIKGMRGAIPKPGRMAEFIRRVREDRALLQWYLDRAPHEDAYTGPVGRVPTFVSEEDILRRERGQLPLFYEDVA